MNDSQNTQAYMLDTNVFNAVLERKVSLAPLAASHLLVTGVQESKLRATNNAQRRADLLAVYRQIQPVPLATSSFAFDIEGAGFDQAEWNDGTGTFERMLVRLQELDAKSKDLRNQSRDILIAETAIKNRAVLVTEDANLRKVVSEFGGRAVDPLSP